MYAGGIEWGWIELAYGGLLLGDSRFDDDYHLPRVSWGILWELNHLWVDLEGNQPSCQ